MDQQIVIRLIVALSTTVFTLMAWCQLVLSVPPKPVSIAVVPMDTNDEYWKSIHAGAVKAARELNVNIIWKGPAKRGDRSAQIDIVESMVNRKVSGIVLAPLDETALFAPVKNSVHMGIPVVIIDSNLKGHSYLSFVATDNYMGGVLAAKHLAGLLNGKGRMVMLRNVEGVASTGLREQGFLDAIKKYPGIKLVSSNQRGSGTAEETYRASENLLTALKAASGKVNVDGIFCSCEGTTFSMLRALQDFGLAGKVRFVGFDASQKLIQALRKRQIDALIIQDPMSMAYLGVKTLVEHIQGKKVPVRIDTEVTIVTPENMTSPKIHELLEPNLSKWLN